MLNGFITTDKINAGGSVHIELMPNGLITNDKINAIGSVHIELRLWHSYIHFREG